MNKKQYIFQCIFSIFLSLVLLLTCFTVTYVTSENEAKGELSYYANQISTSLRDKDDLNNIEEKYSDILDLRITILHSSSDEVLLDINNINRAPYDENRLQEFQENINNFYYKNSLTLNTFVLYHVVLNEDGYLIRVGLTRSSIIDNSIYVLIIGSSILIITTVLYNLYLYHEYKKNLKKIEDEIKKLSKSLDTKERLDYKVDEFNILSNLIDDTSKEIENNIINLTNEKNKIEYIINNLNEGIIVLNQNKEIILINDFILSLLNKSNKEDLLNKNISYLLFPLILEESLNNNNFPSSFEMEFNNKYYEVNLSFIENENKENSLFIILLNDISKVKQTLKMKKEFFQNSSHELKSPLTTIIAYLEMLNNKMISEKEIDETHEILLKNSKRMKELIDNMFYLSSLETDEIESKDLKEISLKNKLDEILKSDINLKLKNKNIRLNLNFNGDITLKIDENDLNELLINLLDNAIKYSNNDTTITINFDQSSSSLEIIDQGIGINEEELDTIFLRFKRSKEAIKSKEEGYGLGLALVKHISLKYNFKIDVESKVNKGSKFTIHFK